MLPKMSGYTKRFNETKDMLFFLGNMMYYQKNIVKPVIVSNNIKKGFDSEPV